jgi:hypothetical protein
MSDEPRVVYSFIRNSREEVRASLGDWGGYRLAHLRIWVDGRDDEPQPTNKGLSLPIEHLPELRNVDEALIAAADEEDAP